nr:OmpA family protein [Methylobacterium sp. WSM2598]
MRPARLLLLTGTILPALLVQPLPGRADPGAAAAIRMAQAGTERGGVERGGPDHGPERGARPEPRERGPERAAPPVERGERAPEPRERAPQRAAPPAERQTPPREAPAREAPPHEASRGERPAPRPEREPAERPEPARPQAPPPDARQPERPTPPRPPEATPPRDERPRAPERPAARPPEPPRPPATPERPAQARPTPPVPSEPGRPPAPPAEPGQPRERPGEAHPGAGAPDRPQGAPARPGQAAPTPPQAAPNPPQAAPTPPPAGSPAVPPGAPTRPQPDPAGPGAAPLPVPGAPGRDGRDRRDGAERRDDAESIPGGFRRSDVEVRSYDEVRRARREVNEGGRLVIREPGRVIVRENDRTFIRHDETERFRSLDRDARVERRGRDVVTIIDRPGGDQIVTVVDEDGRLLRRSRRARDGREVVLIDNTFEGRPRPIERDVVVLPPPEIRIPRERYVVEAERADEGLIYETLTAPPVAPVERRYTLDEVRSSPSLRARMRSVDIDTITFETGSWQVAPDQARRLAAIAEAIRRAVEHNPQEVFLIEGHTDAVGSDVDNLSLSDRRAQEVAAVLTRDFRVPPENLTTQGYGEQYLKVNTQEANRENRRVTARRITPLIQQQAGRP